MKKMTLQRQKSLLGIVLLLPAMLLIVAIVFYPIIYNIQLGFYRVTLNPLRPNTWVGLDNFTRLLTDREFYQVIGLTILFVAVTVIVSTIMGLLVSLLLNRKFKGRGIARSLILLSYVTPLISLVFVWRYMFNALFGAVNYITVDVLGLFSSAPAWFDDTLFAFIMVSIFDSWRIYPFAFMMLLAALQAIDTSLYEAAEVDGASAWAKFWHITLPEITPTIVSVATLRILWNFYKFEDIWLLTTQLNVAGVYLYRTAFAHNNFGMAAAITVILFFVVMLMVVTMRKVVLRNET